MTFRFVQEGKYKIAVIFGQFAPEKRQRTNDGVIRKLLWRQALTPARAALSSARNHF